ncbi:MAG: histidine kinase, partial [Ginsengibacter sp.]
LQVVNITGMVVNIIRIKSCLYPLGNFSAELDYAYKIQPVAKRLNTAISRGYANGVMSDAYLNFGEYETSIAYWRKVVEITEKELPGELVPVYGNSALVFARAKQYDSSLFYARKSYQGVLHNNTSGDALHFFYSNIFEAMGEAFAGNKQYDSALYYYRKSILNSELVDLRFNKIDACNGIAEIYRRQGYTDSAIFYLEKVFAIDGAAKRYPLSILTTATLLATLYETNQQPDSSLKYMHIASDIKDSVYSRDKTSAFQNIIFQQKEKKNEVVKATEKLKNQYQLYFLIIAFIVLIIIATIIIRNRRVKQLQHIRNNIADDLHDDIGSTLSSISIMNELAKEKSPEALPLLTSIGESTSAIQENMSDIVWTINPKNDQFENVLQRMQSFATEILDAKNIQLEFNSDVSLNNVRLTMKQRKNLYLFSKEAINNAAKHSGAKKVIVGICKKENNIEIRIVDNGSGFNTSEIFNSNGMSSLKKRANELHAVYHIKSQMNEGTMVDLKFKIT